MVSGGISIAQVKKVSSPTKSTSSSSSSYSSASKSSSYSAPTKTTASSSNTSSKSYSSNSSSSANDYEEHLDLVEIALKRVEEAINRIKVTASSVYKTITKRNNALNDEISMVTQQIKVQEQAYNQYIQQANSIGLSSSYVEKIKNGSIEINTIKDKDLMEKIKDFQDFYEKAIQAKDAVAELHEEIASIYTEKFDNLSDDYDNELSLLEHLTKTYDKEIDILEEKGLKGSTKLYELLAGVEQQNIDTLERKLADLIDSYSDAMESGEIEKGSKAWYDMQNAINDVKESIQDATLALSEYDNKLRSLKWDYFDFMEDRISSITDEAEFLIDLLGSSDDLFDDNGKMTDKGQATLGLRGQNYNVYMAQADQYGNEVKSITEQLKETPYDTELIERREKLLDLQRKSIQNANSEKKAIQSLIKDGIESELSALKELSNAFTNSLDKSKDLYDYQKKVKNQATEISSLQKQLSAYANDTSEENRSRVQKIQVDLSEAMEELQETEYEKYISEQKKMLDDLYNNYESILNIRVDDVDALISETIDSINSNSASISETILDASEKVGYTLTESMSAIWSNDGNAKAIVSEYGEKFLAQNTSVLNAILGIKVYTDSLVEKANAEAAAKVAKEKATTEAKKPTTSTSNTKTTQQSSTSGTSKKSNHSDQEYYGVALAIWNGGYGWGNDPVRRQRLTEKGFDASRVQSIVNQMGAEGYIRTGAWVGRYYGIKDLTPYHYNRYATGLKMATKDEDAWVNEISPESIISPTNNAIITHIAKGSRVLNGDATQAIWDMANDPSAFIGNHSAGLLKNIGKNGLGEANVTNYNANFESLKLEGTDPKEFMQYLQTDSKFWGMVEDYTIGRINGGSKFKKNRYTW